MRVLAIDTALAACAAAVLDTGHGIVASESLPMLRGHAEALLPLIARVMKQSETNFRDLDRITPGSSDCSSIPGMNKRGVPVGIQPAIQCLSMRSPIMILRAVFVVEDRPGGGARFVMRAGPAPVAAVETARVSDAERRLIHPALEQTFTLSLSRAITFLHSQDPTRTSGEITHWLD
jgi:hypothetical protein